MTSFNILIVGNSGVGKSSYIARHAIGDFTSVHDSTNGINMTTLDFVTNYGEVKVHIYESTFRNMKDLNVAMDAVIVMFDVTNMASFYNAVTAMKHFESMDHLVVCGNKVDVMGRTVVPKLIKFKHYYDISAKSCYNFEAPFRFLLRRLTHNSDLVFTEQ